MTLTSELRRSGLAPVGDIPWGTHICSFFETQQDLLDILVPYFAAGLEQNERCVWITCLPLAPSDAEQAMREHVPDFDRLLAEGRMLFIPYDEWYLRDGVFDMNRVLESWHDCVCSAVDEGFDGLRVSGNTAWLESEDWEAFAEYERTIDSAIKDLPILVF